MAAVAAMLGVPASIAAAGVAGGVAGTLADSVLGATVQGRYRCATCGRDLERPHHRCAGRATRSGGIGWIDNDVVNLLATTVGAGVALGVARTLGV
jgi:uncharacterized membrane protein